MRRYQTIGVSILIGVFSLCLLASGCGERREKVVVVKERSPRKVIVVKERRHRDVVVVEKEKKPRHKVIVVKEKKHHRSDD